MPTRDQTRLEDARKHPRILELWWALRPLKSVIRLMNTGAHPDDETSELLAAISLRDGINLSYACSTRGEGGQNDIGTEAGPALGALRTREMERACDVLNMRMYWHGTSPDDSITDFRFSKSGDETLAIWGRDRLMQRFVDIVRTDRPDIILPTFLDVPGQHGHHRAMTQAAHDVVKAAADPAFPSDLPIWQVSKLYLPAWSGAGQAYDDDLPPPKATLTVQGTGVDPVSGWGFAQVGQMSRGFHRTQGMGRWVTEVDGRDFPLHLAETYINGPDTSLMSGLPQTLADLATNAPDCKDALIAAQNEIDKAHSAFPNFDLVAQAAKSALEHVQAALKNSPGEISHRLEAKEIQLGHVLRLALGVTASATTQDVWLRPGEKTKTIIEFSRGQEADCAAEISLPDGWALENGDIQISKDARPTNAYRAVYDPADPPKPRIDVKIGTATSAIAFDTSPVILPPRAARLSPEAALINLRTASRTVKLDVSDAHPAQEDLSFQTPPGWSVETNGTSVSLTAPHASEEGLFEISAEIGGRAAETERKIAYDHVAPSAHVAPAKLKVRILEVALAGGKIGYIGSGHDSVAHWLTALGADVISLDNRDLGNDASLAAFDTIIIGIFALRFRDGLVAEMPRLHQWVKDGGNLLTLYHRPWDNWDPNKTPPKRIEIGQPSLRWRVTNAAAKVTHLVDHDLLRTPNTITPEDWNGWVKERGLYFAKSWDSAYTPLLSMSDPDEDPLTGALVTANIGKGRHTHCSLILHHQMAMLVPGAYRLMANLIAPCR